MIALFAFAQAADLLTYAPAVEANPLVVALGPVAPLVKVAMVAAVIALMHRNRFARQVYAVGFAVGCIGALTNLAARGIIG